MSDMKLSRKRRGFDRQAAKHTTHVMSQSLKPLTVTDAEMLYVKIRVDNVWSSQLEQCYARPLRDF